VTPGIIHFWAASFLTGGQVKNDVQIQIIPNTRHYHE
jgi:hypothetical protein